MPPPKSPYQPYAAAHQQPSGPGDRRPIAIQILKGNDMLGNLTNKTILITGGSSGIGAVTAAALYETGARLLITARDMAKLERVIDSIVAGSPSREVGFPRPQTIEMHLDSIQAVRNAAALIKADIDTLNILINNAGITFVPESKTVDGLELNMAVNHFSHFLLFQELKPLLLAGTIDRRLNDINFDNKEYDKVSGYAQSKTANIWMGNALSRRYGSMGITGLSVHPGVIATELDRHTTKEEIEALRARFGSSAKSLEQGAATTVWAAVSPHFEDFNNGGRYLADSGECGPLDESGHGYAAHAYDEEHGEKLWKLSCKAVGVVDD